MFFNLEAHLAGILVSFRNIVNRNGQASAFRMSVLNGSKQIGCECRDSALARQVISDEGYFLDLRGFIHNRFRFSSRRVNAAVLRLPHRILYLLRNIVELDRGKAFRLRSLDDGHRYGCGHGAQIVDVRQ